MDDSLQRATATIDLSAVDGPSSSSSPDTAHETKATLAGPAPPEGEDVLSLDPNNSERQYWTDPRTGSQREIWRPGDGDGDWTTDFFDGPGETFPVEKRWRFYQSNTGNGQTNNGVNIPPKCVILDDQAVFDLLKTDIPKAHLGQFWNHDFMLTGKVRARRPNRGRSVVGDPDAAGENKYFFTFVGQLGKDRYFFKGEKDYQPVVYRMPRAPKTESIATTSAVMQQDQSQSDGQPKTHGHHNQYTPKDQLVGRRTVASPAGSDPRANSVSTNKHMPTQPPGTKRHIPAVFQMNIPAVKTPSPVFKVKPSRADESLQKDTRAADPPMEYPAPRFATAQTSEQKPRPIVNDSLALRQPALPATNWDNFIGAPSRSKPGSSLFAQSTGSAFHTTQPPQNLRRTLFAGQQISSTTKTGAFQRTQPFGPGPQIETGFPAEQRKQLRPDTFNITTPGARGAVTNASQGLFCSEPRAKRTASVAASTGSMSAPAKKTKLDPAHQPSSAPSTEPARMDVAHSDPTGMKELKAYALSLETRIGEARCTIEEQADRIEDLEAINQRLKERIRELKGRGT